MSKKDEKIDNAKVDELIATYTLSTKYETAKECIEAAKKAQKQVRHTKFEADREVMAEYNYNTPCYYGHKYTIEPYSNQLVGKDIEVEKNGAITIKTSYKSADGYVCNVYQNQSDDAVKKITINCPDGDKNTEINLTPSTLKNDMVKDKSISPFLESMNVLVETGASMKEMYQEYEIFSTNGYKRDQQYNMQQADQAFAEEAEARRRAATPQSRLSIIDIYTRRTGADRN